MDFQHIKYFMGFLLVASFTHLSKFPCGQFLNGLKFLFVVEARLNTGQDLFCGSAFPLTLSQWSLIFIL